MTDFHQSRWGYKQCFLQLTVDWGWKRKLDWWMSYWFRLNTESHLFDYNLLFTPSTSSHNAHIVAVTSIWDYAILALNLLQVTLFQLGRQKTKFDKLYFYP